MRVLITKVSDSQYREIREFSSLDEMFQYMRRYSDIWIVDFKPNINREFEHDIDLEIRVLDDYAILSTY